MFPQTMGKPFSPSALQADRRVTLGMSQLEEQFSETCFHKTATNIQESKAVAGSVSPREKSSFTAHSFLRLSRIAMWNLLRFLFLWECFFPWEKSVLEHACLRAAPGLCRWATKEGSSPATVTLIPQHRHCPGSHDPLQGACTFPLKVVWG